MKNIYKTFCTYSQSRYSISRILQNNRIALEDFSGDGIELGGVRGIRKGACNFAKGYSSWKFLNFSPSTSPDILADLNHKLPIPDESFDFIVAANTFEHVYNLNNALKEAFRILKKGGKLIAITPFLFQVHGAPDDFHRPTRSCWQCMLEDAGFKANNISIEELYIDAYTSKLSIFDNQLSQKQRFIFRNIFFLPILFKKIDRTNDSFPLSYYVKGIKNN